MPVRWRVSYVRFGGAPVMEKVAAILGLEAVAAEPKVAVVRCNGSCENRPRTALYDGAKSCAIAHATSGGETGCTFGCLGCGDCVEVCQFDAIHMNPRNRPSGSGRRKMYSLWGL